MLNTVLALLLLLQATAARPGVVTGQLQTKDGKPAASIRIAALPAPPVNIRPSDGQNYYATTAPASTTLTDSQGRYRLTNLAPGRYFILASVFEYPTFYPAAATADGAMAIEVGASAPVEGINFTVLLPPGGNVTGRVNVPPPGGRSEIAVLSGLALGQLLETPVASDGSFSFGHLPKGSYLVSLFPTPPGMPSRALQVGDADTRIELVRPSVRTVSGRIVATPAVLRRVLIGFSTSTSYVTTTASPDGSFSAQVQPASHRIDLGGLPPGYTLGSARLGTADVAQGLTVGVGDVTGVTLTVAPPPAVK